MILELIQHMLIFLQSQYFYKYNKKLLNKLMSQDNELRYSYAQQQVNAPASTNHRPHHDTGIPRRNDQNSFIWSTISDIQTEVTPQLLRVKNNILLFLLALSAYGLYYLVGEFRNYIIIGYITGLAYSQTKSKFTAMIRDQKFYKKINESFSLRLLKIIGLLSFVFVLPRLRQMLIHPHEFIYILDYNRYLISFWKLKNVTVIICQVLICTYCLILLLLPKLKKICQKIRPTRDSHVHCMFGIFVFIFAMTFVIMIPAVIFKEVGQVGFVIQQKIQQKLQCQLLNFGSYNETLPLCSERLVENSFIRQMIEEFRSQNQTLVSCKKYIQKLQLDYIGHNVFNYEEIACTWYSIFIKASNYTKTPENNYDLSTASLFQTGTNIFKTLFKTLFGNLASILIAISNLFFCFSIWFATFSLTTQLPNKYLTIKQVFSEKKQQLVGGVTKLITSTCMIVFWHFIASVILLQLFAFTQINLIISIFLSLMAFIPYFRPWFGVLFVAIAKAIFIKDYVQYLTTFIFVLLYSSISEYIYTFYYSKFQIHSIITNLSVVFGIYRFGISGIFYGPLIIIVYTCVEKELLSNYKYKFTTTHNKASVILTQDNPPPRKKQNKKSRHDPQQELQNNIPQQELNSNIQLLKRLSNQHKI